MRTGVSTASLFLRANTEDAMTVLEGMGVKTVEVFLGTFSEYGYPFANVLKEKKGNLNVNSVHDLNTQFEPQLFNMHPRAKADAYAWLGKVFDSANALNAPYYTFHGTARIKRASKSGANDNFPHILCCFEEMCDFAQKRGVTLCLENVEWSTYNRPGVFSKISSAAPNLLGVLDIKQARISEYPYEEYVKEMGNKIAYAHVSDYGERGMCLPGQGNFNFEELICRLKDVGFDGALIVEVYEKDYETPDQLKRSCEFLDELLYKHNCLSE